MLTPPKSRQLGDGLQYRLAQRLHMNSLSNGTTRLTLLSCPDPCQAIAPRRIDSILIIPVWVNSALNGAIPTDPAQLLNPGQAVQHQSSFRGYSVEQA